MRPLDVAGNLTGVYDIGVFRGAIASCALMESPRRLNCTNFVVVIFAAAAATYRFWPRRSTLQKNCGRPVLMLDLGNSFRASVERDPDALAIVDGSVRLTYAQWYRRVSTVVSRSEEHTS